MQFLHPNLLWLGALAIVPVILYLFRRKARRQEVSTLIFFKSLAKEHRESAWLRTLKRLLSLLLSILIIMGATLALGRLVSSGESGSVKSVVILLDRSASMGALDATGVSSMDRAKKAILDKVAALPAAVETSLIAFDGRPEVRQPLSLLRRELARSLRGVEVVPVEGDTDAALATARRIASLKMPSEIWLVSDRASAELAEPVVDEEEGMEEDGVAGTPKVEPVKATVDADSDSPASPSLAPVSGPGTEEGESDAPEIVASDPEEESSPITIVPIDLGVPEFINVGITAFEVRRSPLERNQFEVFLQVANSSSTPDSVEVAIEISIAGSWIATPRRIDLDPGANETLVLPIENAASGQELEVRLTGVDGDAFDTDDVAIAQLPETRATVLAWISENHDPFTELALNAMTDEGELSVAVGGPDAWPAPDVDVVLFDGWLPEEWPEDLPAIVINPPGSSGPVRAVRVESGGIPRENIRSVVADHPVLFRVVAGRVAVTQTAVLDLTGSLQPLWFADEEPLVAAGEVEGQRLAIFAFAPELSEQLPLTAAWPLLLENAILWCSEPGRAKFESPILPAGSLIEAGGDRLAWRAWNGEKFAVAEDDLGSSRMAALHRIGLWTTADAARTGSSLLLSGKETDFGGADTGGNLPDEVAKKPSATSLFAGDPTRMFLWIIVAILVIESLLFHRFSVY